MRMTGILMVLGILVFLPFQVVRADTIVSQTTADTNSAETISNSLVQGLGTGLNGVLSVMSIRYDISLVATSSTYRSVSMVLHGCPGSSYAVNCNVGTKFWESGWISVTGSGPGSYTFTSSTTNEVLDPSLYYFVVVDVNQYNKNDVFIKGSATNNYANGACVGAYCGSILDIYFVASGAIGYSSSQSEGITAITSPLNQSVTANNTPNFAYTYYIMHAYNRAGVILRDLTTGQTINTTVASSTISASGSNSYSQYIGVTSGHLYEWQPIVYDTTGVLPSIYGQKYVFYAVTTAQYQSIPSQITSWVGSSSISSTGYTGSTSTGLVASSSWNGQTYYSFASTTGFARCFGYFPDNLRQAMATHIPFSYICDAQTLISKMINGSGNASGDVVLDYPVILGHDLGTSTTLIDKDFVANLDAVQTIKRVGGYALYLATGLAVIWAVARIL